MSEQQDILPFEPERNRPAQDTALTVGQLINLWIRQMGPRQAFRTLEGRQQVLDKFTETFGGRLIWSLKKHELEFWINGHTEWRSDWTIKRVLGTIQCVFNWGAKIELIDRNPFFGMTHPDGERGRPVTDAEFQALLRCADPIFRRVLVFMLFTGARPGEMSSLEWGFIDPGRECISLKHHKTAKKRKDKAPRTIVLYHPVLRLLIWIKRHQPESQYVFLNSRGRPWTRNSLALRIMRLRERCGLPQDAKLYGVRHRFGTQAILKGCDLKTLAELMGHTTTRMTEYYVHLAGQTDHLKAAVKKIFEK